MTDATTTLPLAGVRVIELGTGIASAYCTKLFVDAGADVVKVEPPGGDPLRLVRDGKSSSPLFKHLYASKGSIVLDPASERDLARLWATLATADVVVAAPASDGALWPGVALTDLRSRHPNIVAVTITPFGTTGPWAGRPANEFTLQGWCGSTGGRGDPDRPPVAAGGRLGEWASGLTAAVAALGTVYGVRGGMQGDHIDVSMLEVMTTIFNGAHAVAAQLDGLGPQPDLVARSIDTPSIEAVADGWVGFATNSPSQFRSFADMLGHLEWLDDDELARGDRRQRNSHRLRPAIAEALCRRRVADVLAEAELRRIPAAPVGNGRVTPSFDHLVERVTFLQSHDGTFLQPRVPYRLSAIAARPFGAAPELGLHTAEWASAVDRSRDASSPRPDPDTPRLPLEGVRVFDLTAYWAGPYASQILGFLGASVVKVESTQRPDGTRMGTSYATVGDRPWELAPLFHANNTGKQGITLDLTNPVGVELGRRLLQQCDVFIENFSPRVVERFGLLDDRAWSDNPGLVAVRIPAWGLTGPWRERSGFAQNMEQATGLAWLTGYRDSPPIVPKGPCDPIGGMHAAFAALVALFHRDRTGHGQLVEAPLVDAALNVAAQQVVDWTASHYLWEREGNRGPSGAPQGVYACAGKERWLALSVESDAQWAALCDALGHPRSLADPRFATDVERRVHHDELDSLLTASFKPLELDAAIQSVWSRGVPVAAVDLPRTVASNPQMSARAFFTELEHPVAGIVRYPGFGARWADRRQPLHRCPPPLLGQHNREVLGTLLGVDGAGLDELDACGITGSRPA